ncbi:MAG: hypothetical protein WC804_18355 [Sphingomonas sp.]|jgi:hypothetical protein|uniref:hypothetical protein n=1 Tax=Sphingomonas sp. TaxID=28214 RepID=UPI003562D5F7
MRNTESSSGAPLDRGGSPNGYVRIHRALLGHPVFRNDAEAMAFAWLVLRAGWQPGRVRYKDRVIGLRRGQLALSIRDFAAAMDRPKGWVERLFARLRNETMIETSVGHGVLLITICNYDFYQASSEGRETGAGTRGEAPAGQRPDTDKRREESKKGNPPLEPAGGVAKIFLPKDWEIPPVADLPPNARACATQWSAESYAAHGEAFAGYWRGRRGRNADWDAAWANRVVTIHGLVLRDEKYGRAAPATDAAPARPAMSADDRTAYLARLAAQPWAAATPRSPASGATT